MTRRIWSTITGSVLAAGLIGVVIAVAVSSSPAQAEPDPEPEIDPVELFQSAEKLNPKEATALAQFLQSSTWGVARTRKGVEWTFTGTAVPIGAYTSNPIIEDDTTVLPDGIYWVGEAGELKAGGDAYWFDANQLFIVGEAWAGGTDTKGVTCRDGWYACCYYKDGGDQEPVAKCVTNGTPANCYAGGPGTVSCSLSGTGSVPVGCEVECADGYHACCEDENNQPACDCLPINPTVTGDNPCGDVQNAEGNAACDSDTSVSFYQGDDLVVEDAEGQD